METAHNLLERAADATRERDADALRRSLIRTLEEVLTPRWASIVDLAADSEDAGGIGATRASTPSDSSEPIDSPRYRPGSEEVRAALRAGPGPWLTDYADGSRLFLKGLGDESALLTRLEGAGPQDLRLIDSFCRLYENFLSVLREAERDRLTGLLNRRSFDQWLDRIATAGLSPGADPKPREPSTVPRGPLWWWLALFDVDHFKKINDRFGHLYGDEVLLLLARLTKQCVRGEDRCFRYGGEEFAVLLARNDEGGVRVALERLRQRVEQYPFPQVGKVTISIGCAPLQPGMASAMAIDRADRALYAAKHNGRNQTVIMPRAMAGQPSEPMPMVGSVELF